MAMNVTPFQSTDEFTMAGFNGKISDINSGVDTEITSALSGFARIETGSYVGTGTYGQANPNTLTFGFASKMVMVSSSTINTASSNLITPMIWFDGVMSAFASPGGYLNHFTVDGNTISWYSTSTYTKDQYNNNGETYYYIAIG